MKRINLLAVLMALVTSNLSGCIVTRDDGYHSYRNEHGDLNIDGIRYVGWCDSHPHDARCHSVAT